MQLPPLTELTSNAHVVSIPLRVRFRGIEHREALFFQGPRGWAEFNPFVEYDDHESAHWLAAAIDFGWAEPAAQFRHSIPVNATIPAISPENVASVLASFVGCRTAKVKVAQTGQSLDEDTARVRRVRELLGSAGRIRIDANGGWSVPDAVRAITSLAEFGLEYVEQPCASLPELSELRQLLQAELGDETPLIAADESIRKAQDPFDVARSNAADLLVLKAGPLGGVHRLLDIARETELPVVVSSALDTSVGISMGLAAAASLPNLDFDCGLGTVALLAGDVTAEPLLAEAGQLEVRRVDVHEILLAHQAADEERRNWWLARLERCYRVLESSAG